MDKKELKSMIKSAKDKIAGRSKGAKAKALKKMC